MGRPSQSQALEVWMNGVRVGTWRIAANGGHEFVYAESWLGSNAARPLSLSLPLGEPGARLRGAVVAAYFDNLLPDNRAIRERMRQRFAANSAAPFDLLAAVGRDCVGAVQLLPEGSERPMVWSIEGEPLSERRIEEMLDKLLMQVPGRADAAGDDFRLSLAGAQEKTALLRWKGKWLRPIGATPTTHILKLPIGAGARGIDLSTSVENEWLCAQILKAFAMPVADCSMASFGARKVLVVERFDRRLARDGKWLMRLPQEDFCQATGAPPDHKYEADGGPSARAILDLLLGSGNAAADRADFFRSQVLFWMLCAIDGHAKNFSLFIEAQGRYRLTPRYDVLSAYPVLGKKAGQLQTQKVKMAMHVEGENRHYLWHSILPRHWRESARRWGLGQVVEGVLDDLSARAPAVVDAVSGQLPKGFPDGVATPVLKGLLAAAKKLAA